MCQSLKYDITTNKAATLSNLNIVEKYINKLNNIDSSNITSLRLLQSKYYLKILDIPYLVDNINLPIILNIIMWVIKIAYLFKDTILASHPYVIKASLKSDMAIV